MTERPEMLEVGLQIPLQMITGNDLETFLVQFTAVTRQIGERLYQDYGGGKDRHIIIGGNGGRPKGEQ